MRFPAIIFALSLPLITMTSPASAQSGAGCFLNAYAGGSITSLRPVSTSGMRDVDRIVREEASRLERMFRMRPALTYFQEPPSMGQNAFATTYRFFPQMPHGTVMLGINLLRNEVRSGGWSWETPIVGIMAHEWAHIYQQQTPSLSGRPVPWKELHADFLAGWYMGLRFREGWQGDSRSFSQSLFDKGDFGYFDPDHHGLPVQRTLIMTEGLFYASETGQQDVRSAAAEGARLIYMQNGRPEIRIQRSLRPCAPNCER